MNRELSTFLDALRLLAAVFVVLSHLSWQRISGGALPSFPGHAAVIVFFVLSGYVVAYAATQREHGPRDYAFNRLARLWSVALPALALTALLDVAGRTLEPSIYPADAQTDPLWRLLASAFFVSQSWFLDVRPLSNEPFWSLPYEFWYYVMFGAWLHLRGRKRVVALAAASLVAGPKILLYLPLWAYGVWLFHRPASASGVWPARIRFLLCVAVLPLLYLLGYRTRVDVAWLPTGFSVLDYAIALAVGGCIRAFPHCGLSLAAVEVPVRRAAASTFSIYLYHLPVMLLLAAATAGVVEGAPRVLLMLLGTLGACALLARITEHQKKPVRRALEAAWDAIATATRPRRAVPSASKLPRRP